MTALEKQTYTDGFLVLLLTSRREPRTGMYALRAQLFDGGRLAADWLRSDLPPGLTHQTVPGLRDLLRRVLPEPHILACCGTAWQTILEQCATDLVPLCRILDLTATARTLTTLPQQVGPDRIADALDLARVIPEDTPFSDFEEDLLWALIREAGIQERTWAELLRMAAEAREPLSFDPYDFDESAITSLPEKPGVYIMRDADRGVLYVGKAGSLAARLADYFRFRSCVPSKLERIRDRIRSFEYRLVGSELEALLVENALIRELEPAVNVQRSITPGASRYHVRPEPVLVCLPSATPNRRELFLFGGREHAFQLKTIPSRPPAATVTRLVTFLNGFSASQPRHPHLHDWGRVGSEICWRYWSRFRNNLTWFFAGGKTAGNTAQLRQALKSAAQQPDAAEFRLETDVGV